MKYEVSPNFIPLTSIHSINATRMPAHPYHLVDCSPWPLIMSFALLFFALILCSWFTFKLTTWTYPILCVSLITVTLYAWFRDVARESQGGFHTTRTQSGLLISFLIF